MEGVEAAAATETEEKERTLEAEARQPLLEPFCYEAGRRRASCTGGDLGVSRDMSSGSR